MPHRPKVNDEDIGIRAFQLRRAKAVERATEKVRRGMDTGWKHLTSLEIEELEWTLGELWTYAARDDWGGLHFSRLELSDVREIIKLGRQLRQHSRSDVNVLEDVAAVITAKQS